MLLKLEKIYLFSINLIMTNGLYENTSAPFVCWKVVSFWKVNSGESEFQESEFRESIFRCLVV
jgi:hypothetical protein